MLNHVKSAISLALEGLFPDVVWRIRGWGGST
jgi:hypothetical protein